MVKGLKLSLPVLFVLFIVAMMVLFAGIFYRSFLISGYVEFKDLILPHDDTLVFTGDIMLARDVEDLMIAHGKEYPYTGLWLMISKKDEVVGNFEASIPTEHTPTKTGEMTFSVNANYIKALHTAGFDHMSLANNHSYDYGVSGFNNTETELLEGGLLPFGDANTLDTEKIRYIKNNEDIIALIGVNLVTQKWSETEIHDLLQEANSLSDKQVVYVHWGNEYEQTHSDEQELYAQWFIDAGTDLVIGMHPHVVQDIQLIKNVPVFYSLGNFIFDQYFSDEVMEGLVVKTVFTDQMKITLIPVTTKDSHGQPHKMKREETNRFFHDLADRSDPNLAEMIINGQIVLE